MEAKVHGRLVKRGDLNTKYFHATTSQRFKMNTVTKLLNIDGIWISNKKDLKALAVEHFTNKFSPRSRTSI